MEYKKVLTLVKPSNGNLTFKFFSFEDYTASHHLQRLDYYSIILIEKGQENQKQILLNSILSQIR